MIRAFVFDLDGTLVETEELEALSYARAAAELRVLEILGLADEFDVVVTRDDVEHGKPNPEMHLLAARELGVRPEECLAIEDSPAGVKAALAAGTEIVAVTTDLTRQKFRDTNLLDRSYVVDDPSALPTVVRHLISVHGQPLGG
jgi:beta-phosphoglucomutase-like phosphatase (HAD superfamily)